MEFKKLLQKCREQSGSNKTDLANRIGTTPSYYMQLESGARKAPTIDLARKIATALRLNKNETEHLVAVAARERLQSEELDIVLSSIPKSLLEEKTAECYEWSSIRGESECPHCRKNIDVEVDREGNVTLSSKVSTKVKKR